jgi:hypothetical protein
MPHVRHHSCQYSVYSYPVSHTRPRVTRAVRSQLELHGSRRVLGACVVVEVVSTVQVLSLGRNIILKLHQASYFLFGFRSCILALKVTSRCTSKERDFGLDAEAPALSDESFPARQELTITAERRTRAPQHLLSSYDVVR